MPRSPIVLALLLLCVAFPASAPAQGLYEPFPEPAPNGRSSVYLEQLGVHATRAALRQGRFVGRAGAGRLAPAGPATGAAGAASLRAGSGSSRGLALLAALGSALLAAALLLVRRAR